jgi:endonuclease/exonuclease/phosphatase family metal-dependent hydrolase
VLCDLNGLGGQSSGLLDLVLRKERRTLVMGDLNALGGTTRDRAKSVTEEPRDNARNPSHAKACWDWETRNAAFRAAASA